MADLGRKQTGRDAVSQYNDGRCDECNGELLASPYVGGDHDPIAECRSCGKHFGCWACERS